MKYHICVVIIHIDSGLMWWLQVGITKPNPYYSIAHGIKFQCNSQSEEKKKEKKNTNPHTLHSNHLQGHYSHHKTNHGSKRRWTEGFLGELGGPAFFVGEHMAELWLNPHSSTHGSFVQKSEPRLHVGVMGESPVQ